MFAFVLTLVGTRAYAQENEREIASRVHGEGGYSSDITVLVPEMRRCDSDGGMCEDELSGEGRGPRAHTSGSQERTEDPGANRESPSWVRDWIAWLDALLSLAAQPLGWGLLAALAIAMLVLTGLFIARIRLSNPGKVASSHESSVTSPLDPLLQTSGMRAEDLAAEGRYREAIHELFIDALRNVGGLRGTHRARTARELVSMLPAERVGHAELARLLDLTELVWFGGRPATESQYREARELSQAVKPIAPEEMRGPDE